MLIHKFEPSEFCLNLKRYERSNVGFKYLKMYLVHFWIYGRTCATCRPLSGSTTSQLVLHDHAPADRLSITQLCATADGISRPFFLDVARAPQPVHHALRRPGAAAVRTSEASRRSRVRSSASDVQRADGRVFTPRGARAVARTRQERRIFRVGRRVELKGCVFTLRSGKKKGTLFL